LKTAQAQIQLFPILPKPAVGECFNAYRLFFRSPFLPPFPKRFVSIPASENCQKKENPLFFMRNLQKNSLKHIFRPLSYISFYTFAQT